MEPVIFEHSAGDHYSLATLYYGVDVIKGLKFLPDQSVQTVCTSPPYWGLRDYQAEGQIGLEKTPDEYVEHLVEVFTEVWRVLRNDGTVWLNLGDSYARAGGESGGNNRELLHMEGRQRRMSSVPKGSGLKQKDLVGIPWMVAFALRAAGWFLRSDIIWTKSNCMPESVTDRPTSAHEHIFLLAKGEKYLYNQDSIREGYKDVRENASATFCRENSKRSESMVGQAMGTHRPGREDDVYGHGGRNRRNVWDVSVKAYQGAHFAVWPEKLVEPMILAGSNEGDTVLDPFSGSATTGWVALRNKRHFIGIDLNAEYLDLALARLQDRPAPVKSEAEDDVLDLW